MNEPLLKFFIAGEPYPQGSKTGIYRGGRCILIESKGKGTAKHKKWRDIASDAAKRASKPLSEPLDGPLWVDLAFHLHKPPSRPGGDRWVYVRPDLDKLVRAVLDSLTTGGVLSEDSRVSRIAASKQYAIDGPSGVWVSVGQLDHGDSLPFDDA